MAELIVRTSMILVMAWIASRALARATAATRHLLWHAAILAVLAAPLLSPFAPPFTVPGVPAMPAAFSTPAAPSVTAPMPGVMPGSERRVAGGAAERLGPRTSLDTLAAIWLTGTLLVFVWFASGIIAVTRLARRSPAAPLKWQAEADRLCQQIGIRARVAVRVMPHDGSPLTIGWLKSSILLPPHATGWDEERRQTVLLHELAHVRRHDCLVQRLAQIACTLYWFNPLIWLSASALRRERERACDDEVLSHGASASAYASHLLEIARDLQPRFTSRAALAMARPRELEGRLLAILAAGRTRVPARHARWMVAITIALSTAAALGAHPESPATRMSNRATDQQTASQAAGRADLSFATLAGALEDPDPQVREKAAITLAFSLDADVIPVLIEALGDPDAQVREKAAIGLVFRQDPRVVEPLLVAARDEDSQVREKAIIALGSSGDPRALAAVEAALHDPDGQVREKAVAALTLLRTSGGAGQQMGTGLRRLIGGLLQLAR